MRSLLVFRRLVTAHGIRQLQGQPLQQSILKLRLGATPSSSCVRREMSSRASGGAQVPILARFRSRLSHRFQQIRRSSSDKSSSPSPNPTPHLGSPPSQTLSARLKQLSREYGWTAFGVYMALSALDFPFCFLAVRLAGPERIGHYEHVVVEYFWKIVNIPLGGKQEEQRQQQPDEAIAVTKQGKQGTGEAARVGGGWGVEEAQEANEKEATIWTQLALAYAIHKSFIFIRIPLTAAILPRVVKTLRGWGWNIGKRTPKPVPAK